MGKSIKFNDVHVDESLTCTLKCLRITVSRKDFVYSLVLVKVYSLFVADHLNSTPITLSFLICYIYLEGEV